MRNEGLFSVTELIVQRIPGVKIFPMSILRIFFNHKHCIVFWAFSMSHLLLTQSEISFKYVKRSSIAQGVFNLVYLLILNFSCVMHGQLLL